MADLGERLPAFNIIGGSRLMGGDRAVVQALYGMGGVGKTQLATEYVHQFADGYDVVWWISAQQGAFVGDQFAALADALGCVQPGAGLAVIRQAVLTELRERGPWLLVFDNADDPEDIARWLPGSGGHVLITSRAHRWAEVAVPVEVDVLARSESVAILRDRVPGLDGAEADRVAAALGDLPLAVVQAAAFMADTGMPGEEYTSLLGSRVAEILDQGRPASYSQSLAAVIQLAFDRLFKENRAAAQAIGICAFLAPEPVPTDWFTRAVNQLPAPLREQATDQLAWRQVLAHVGRYALARVDRDTLLMHRLTQAIVRKHLSPITANQAHAEAILGANRPGDPADSRTWPRWALQIPHVIALDPASTDSGGMRSCACSAASYLTYRGDARSGHDLARRLYDHWHKRLGPDNRYTLWASNCLAHAFREMGRYDEARQLDEVTFALNRRNLGDDNPHTLTAANNLAFDRRELGDLRTARDLDEDTLARRRRVLGDDHRATLTSAHNLAIDLRQLGHVQAARELDEDTLVRRRHIVGTDHFSTLTTANNLAMDLRELGDVQAARELDEDTLARFRRVLGEDHPYTLRSASNLAMDLRELGEAQAARELDEDTLARRRRVL